MLLVAASRRRDRYRPIVATSVPEDSPWHLAYAAGLGLLPIDGDQELLERVLANPELTIDEMLPIERQHCAEPGLDDLLSRLSNPTAVAASLLALSPRPLRSTVHATDDWLIEPTTLARQKGTGIVVLYRPGDVADLCLLWNLRSLHGWPAGLPIGMPWPENDREATDALVDQLALLAGRTDLYSGAMSFGLVVVSASIPHRELVQLVDEAQARGAANLEWGEPPQLLAPAYAPTRITNETLLFTDGAALVPTRMEGDREWLAVAAQTPMRPPLRLSVTLRGGPMPTGRTLFGDPYEDTKVLATLEVPTPQTEAVTSCVRRSGRASGPCCVPSPLIAGFEWSPLHRGAPQWRCYRCFRIFEKSDGLPTGRCLTCSIGQLRAAG